MKLPSNLETFCLYRSVRRFGAIDRDYHGGSSTRGGMTMFGTQEDITLENNAKEDEAELF